MTQLKTAPTPAVPSPYLPKMGRIIETETFTETEKFFRIVLADRSHLNHAPGQFIEVSVFGIGEAPISISSSPTQPDSFDLCVRNVGHVTNAMHALAVGDELGIRGPFGHGFDTEAAIGKDILFVAGGLGLAPTRSFIKYVIDRRDRYNNVTILVGAKNPGLLLFKKELDAWQSRPDVRCLVTVDRADGSWKGRTGLITTLFRQVNIDPRNTLAVIVGPPIMFKFAVLEALSLGIAEHSILCSLERRMKCGVGKCGHCQIRHIYVCQDGPVFTYADVKALREGI